jgi:hypothetical protein
MAIGKLSWIACAPRCGSPLGVTAQNTGGRLTTEQRMKDHIASLVREANGLPIDPLAGPRAARHGPA